MAKYRIAVIVGSIRAGSINRKIAGALIAAAPDSLDFELVEIADLPLYNQDLDPTPPAQWVGFKQRIAAADGLLFVTPEYNRSIPGVLKNAIDIGSRPYGHSAWGGKPAAIVTASPGAVGGFGANHHLRQCCVFLDIPLMQQPEAYLGGVEDKFGEDGRPADSKLAGFIDTFAVAYAGWIERMARG